MRYHRAGRKGQGTVEFALAVILLLAILCAILEFSWVFYNYAYLNNIVSKGARLGVPTANTGNNSDAVIASFITSAIGGLPITTATPYPLTDPSGNVTTSRAPGNILTVTGTMTYNSITPLSSLVSKSSLGTLRTSCSVILE